MSTSTDPALKVEAAQTQEKFSGLFTAAAVFGFLRMDGNRPGTRVHYDGDTGDELRAGLSAVVKTGVRGAR